MKRVNCSKGSTIIETLVALVILGITLAGAFGTFTFTMRVSDRTHSELTMMSEISNRLETIRSENYISVVNSVWPMSPGQNMRSRNKVTVEEESDARGISYSYDYTPLYNSPSSNLPEAIQIEVTATQSNSFLGNREVSFFTILSYAL